VSRLVGVPLVPSGDGKVRQWVGVWDRFFSDRKVFLGQDLGEDTVSVVVASLLYLDYCCKSDIYICINCSGDEVLPCLALLDTMRSVKANIGTIGLGRCLGMAGFVLAMGYKPFRYALSNTRIMLYHPSCVVRGQAIDIYREVHELVKVREYMEQLISEQSGKDSEKISSDLQRNLYLDSQEAIEYGILDGVMRQFLC